MVRVRWELSQLGERLFVTFPNDKHDGNPATGRQRTGEDADRVGVRALEGPGPEAWGREAWGREASIGGCRDRTPPTDPGGLMGQAICPKGFSREGLWGVNSSAPSGVITMSSSSRTPNSPGM